MELTDYPIRQGQSNIRKVSQVNTTGKPPREQRRLAGDPAGYRVLLGLQFAAIGVIYVLPEDISVGAQSRRIITVSKNGRITFATHIGMMISGG